MHLPPYSSLSQWRWFLKFFVETESCDWIDKSVRTYKNRKEVSNEPGEIATLVIEILRIRGIKLFTN